MAQATSLHSPSFDDLVFAQPSLASFATPHRKPPSVQIPVAGSQRAVRFASPWFVRKSYRKPAASQWPAFCGLMRVHGIPMFCPVDHFENVSAAQVPIRFARRGAAEPLLPMEMRTADAIELTCFDPGRNQWRWPAELERVDQLPTLVQTVRQAVGANTPIGMSIPVGVNSEDLQTVFAARPDFLTLDSLNSLHPNHAGLLMETLCRVRELNQALTLPMAVMVVYDLVDTQHTLKLLALGATAVSVDSVIARTLVENRPQTIEVSGGMLSGIGLPTQPRNDLSALEKALVALHSELSVGMAAIGIAELSELNPHRLRSLSVTTNKLAGIKLLVEP